MLGIRDPRLLWEITPGDLEAMVEAVGWHRAREAGVDPDRLPMTPAEESEWWASMEAGAAEYEARERPGGT